MPTILAYGDFGNQTATTVAASSGSPAPGGRYNWATTAGTDRAVGFLTTGTYVSSNAILVGYENSTGASVTSATLQFRVERYKVNTNTFRLALYSSTTGAAGSWTAQPAGDISSAVFAPGASAGTFSTPRTVYKSVTVSGLNLTGGEDLYFMWVFTTPGNTNSQGIGLDDVTVQMGTGALAVSASLTDALCKQT